MKNNETHNTRGIQPMYLYLKAIAVIMLSIRPLVAQLSVTDKLERTWSDATGKYQVVARLEEIKEKEVLLVRSVDGKEVLIPIERLSEADSKFIEMVRTREKDKKSIHEESGSLELLRDAIDKIIDEQRSAQEGSETTIQSQRRRTKIIESLHRATKDRNITLFLEVKDVRQAESSRPPINDIIMPESKDSRLRRQAREREVFDIEIRPRKYAIEMPDEFTLRTGLSAEELKVGTYFCLRCKFGRNDKALGDFFIRYRDARFELSIVECFIPDQVIAGQIMDKLHPEINRPKGPRFNSLELTRAQFRNLFFELDGTAEDFISEVKVDDLIKLFGPPTRKTNVRSTESWIYKCTDGVVVLEVDKDAEGLLPEGYLFISAVNDF